MQNQAPENFYKQMMNEDPELSRLNRQIASMWMVFWRVVGGFAILFAFILVFSYFNHRHH